MIKHLLFAALLICVCVFAAPPPNAVAAYNVFNGVKCDKTGAKSGDPTQSAVCVSQTNQDPISGQNGALLKVTNIVAFAAGAAGLILIILGGIRYITSDGDSNKIASAKSTIIGALIGLIIIAAGRTLINYVVTRL